MNIDNLTPEFRQETKFTKFNQAKLFNENSLVKIEKPLNKDNPSDITLNINDFLEEQEGYRSFKSFSSYTLQYRNNSGNIYSKERKSRYPVNDSKCPLYLRFMNILRHDYNNYYNSALIDLYDSHKNNSSNRIKKKDLLKIATVDGKINCGIDF
ncbi:hypothetical protein BCR36DRAFT_331129 [Piromyces finnis]|uniref:Uncharacterized protein n=1 Tax=Piromyces finnis TaxID=1754191 RepID=A0A1Y1V651_9FUNG|nr:hypothetical protein BCR36DRAFT_331129 [Piromyces finnis]|eukprot:ORX46893.1 hypothetical protein BCR36DRAFT_331129 [Piromyces finnis]